MIGTCLMLCVPGPWVDHTALIAAVVGSSRGRFMLAGRILAVPFDKRHVEVDLEGPNEHMRSSFAYAGRGVIDESLLNHIGGHGCTVYLRFGLPVTEARADLLDFSQALQAAGGFAVKVETCGIAHNWETWFERMRSDNPFDWYRSMVVLIGDEAVYYSCGMHQFGLPDVELPRSAEALTSAADLMNQFNLYQILERPDLRDGHSFSLDARSPKFRISAHKDQRHPGEDLFHNPYGYWRLSPMS